MFQSQFTFAHRFDQVSGSAIREIFKVIAQPGMISFAGGNPSPAALPDEAVRLLSDEVLRENGKVLLQYGATEGYPPFVESLLQYVRDMLKCDIPAVLPVTGSTQAMDLLCKSLIDPGDNILVENPSFLGNMQCMKLYQANLVPVDSDEDGMIMEDLEKKILQYKPKMLYTIPTFQNPTGKTLPEERRRKVAELANRYHMVVAEDDPYRDLRYEGKPPDLIRKCTVGKQSTDVHTANLNQAVVDLFIRRRLLPEHIRTICADYGTKMKFMLSKLSEFPGNVRYTKPQGGLFIWAELPDHLNAKALLDKAVEKKVAYVPGTHFCVNGGHENTIRLNFSNSSMEQIETGMDILKKLVAENI